MSQNKKSLYKPYKSWQLLLATLLCLSASYRTARAQDLLQASQELSQLLQSEAFTPSLEFFNDHYEIYFNGTTQAADNPTNIVRLEQLGVYTISFPDLAPTVRATTLLRLGDRTDTLRTNHSIIIFNQAGYVNWEAIGPTDTLTQNADTDIDCSGCKYKKDQITETSQIIQISARDGNSINFTVADTEFYLAPEERLILSPGENHWLGQIRGRRNQLSKPTQQLLEMWYRFIAYKDPNWQEVSLADLRKELYENPFFPEEIANLVPESPIKVSTYLPPAKRPVIPDWQQRLHQSKKAYNVSLQPDLQYNKLEEPVMAAHQVAAQQAAGVYASDERLGIGFNQDQILRGLASFIEERAQEELNVAFLNRMRNKLSKDSLLLTIFPNTAMLFDQFELDNYRFIMENAKTVFTTDLSNLGLNIYNVFQLQSLNEEFKYSSELYFAALVLKMINMVYLDVPTDTILINSYLALENQAKILELDLRNKTAQALLQNPSVQQKLLRSYRSYANQLSGGVAALQQQVDSLEAISQQLKQQIPYTHPLYQRVWEIDDEVNDLKAQMARWQNQFEEASVTRQNQLQGQPSREYILKHSQLDNYNRFFPARPDAPQATVSQGLEQLSQELKSRESLQLTDWKSNASYLTQAILDLKLKWFTIQENQVSQRAIQTYIAYQMLEQALHTELEWWKQDSTNQRALLALEFLDSTLYQDQKITLNYTKLQQDLLADRTNFQQVRTYLPILEEALRETYAPLLEQYSSQLRNGKDTIAAPNVEGNTLVYNRALPAFRSLFEAKENAPEVPPDAFEDLLDSLQQFFPTLPQSSVPNGKSKAFVNTFSLALDSILQYSHLESERLRQQFLEINQTLDTLNRSVYRIQLAKQDIAEQLEVFQQAQPDSILLKSSSRIHSLSKVFAVGTHLVQALRSQSSNAVLGLNADSSITAQKWLSLNELNAAFKADSLSRSMFFGLLYEDILHIPDLQLGKKGSRLQAEQVATLSTSILRGIQQLYQLEEKRKQLEAKGEKLSLTEYSALIFETLRIVDMSFKLFKEQPGPASEKALLNSGSQILNQSNQLYQNLVDKQYNMVVSNLAALVQALVTDNSNRKLQREADQFKSKLLTYGSFMAAVALAQNADQVKTALETASVEVGYSRVKRVNKANIAINAYFGLGTGYERGSNGYRSKLQLNLATPVGLSFSRSIGKGNSLSLFGSVLDLGPIVTYDFDSNSTLSSSELKFDDFIAPGAFLFWNIANTPFTLGGGLQRTPKIRMLEGSTEAQRTTRVLFNFLIDIPIFNLYTKKN